MKDKMKNWAQDQLVKLVIRLFAKNPKLAAIIQWISFFGASGMYLLDYLKAMPIDEATKSKIIISATAIITICQLFQKNLPQTEIQETKK